MKISRELSKNKSGHVVYMLDEPTTGLHFDDTKRLIGVLNRLVDKGNTVYVIEHNLDVVKSCDYLLDMGPEGGDGRRQDNRERHAGGAGEGEAPPTPASS